MTDDWLDAYLFAKKVLRDRLEVLCAEMTVIGHELSVVEQALAEMGQPHLRPVRRPELRLVRS